MEPSARHKPLITLLLGYLYIINRRKEAIEKSGRGRVEKIAKKIEIIAPRKIIICIFIAENENKNANQSEYICQSKVVTAIFVSVAY